MADYICTKCHYIGKPAKKKQGSTKIEFCGWMVFPLGLPYTIWRMVSKINVCRHCGEKFLISVNSPPGKRLAALMGAEIGDESLAEIPKNMPIVQKPAPAEAAPKEKPAPPPRRYQDPDKW